MQSKEINKKKKKKLSQSKFSLSFKHQFEY